MKFGQSCLHSRSDMLHTPSRVLCLRWFRDWKLRSKSIAENVYEVCDFHGSELCLSGLAQRRRAICMDSEQFQGAAGVYAPVLREGAALEKLCRSGFHDIACHTQGPRQATISYICCENKSRRLPGYPVFIVSGSSDRPSTTPDTSPCCIGADGHWILWYPRRQGVISCFASAS